MLHEQLVFQRLVARNEGQRDPLKSLQTRECMESMPTVQEGDQGESSLLPDKHYVSGVLSVEGAWHLLQEPEWSCEKNLLSCHEDRVPVYTEYLQGVANLKEEALFRWR